MKGVEIDPDLLASLVEDLRAKRAPMELVLQASSALHLAGLIQLARRHPRLSDKDRATADRFLLGVVDYFWDCPAALEVLRRGGMA